MKRNSSPENDDGPVQKRFTDEKRVLEFYERVHTHGEVIWSGTVEIHDSQKIVFDCSIKALPQNEGIESFLHLKQFTMHILPVSVLLSLIPYMEQSRGLILCTDENTDMMSYSAFSQAIRPGSEKAGCTVLKNTASALHLLWVHSFPSGQEDHITGFIIAYQANDDVLGILRSHGLLQCVNPEHSEERPMVEVIKQLENWERGKQLLAQEHATMKVDVQRKESMLQERKTELTNMKMKLNKKKKQIMEKDKVLKEWQHKYKVLAKEKTKLEEEQKEMVGKKEGEIKSLQGQMKKQIKLVKEKEKKLTEMEKEREEMKTQIMEKDKALTEKSSALKRESGKLRKKNEALKQQQHEYEVLAKEKTKLEAEQKEMIEKKNKEIVSLQGKMEKQIKLVEEKEKKLTEMERQIMEKDEALMEKGNALTVKDIEIIALQQNQHESKTSRLKLNEVAMKQAGIKRMVEKDGECSICQRLFIKATTLNCSHSFCDYCIQKWWKDYPTCPLCREKIEYVVHNKALDNFIQGIVDQLGNEIKQRREEAVEEREQEIQEEGPLYSDSEYNSQSDDDASSVASAYSANSPSSPWQQLSVNALDLQLCAYRPSPPESFGRC